MIRVGDKVAPFFNMGQIGTVILIESATPKTYTIGGTQSTISIAHVQLDNDKKTIMKYKAEDLLKAGM